MPAALPTLVVIGAMKCGTSALHTYLDAHPQIQMSEPKELNFFSGLEWHRGMAWYAAHFDGSMPVRGESSPGYTSPDLPEAALRMAAVLPDVRLLFSVRNPVQRALSQYAHHRREGTERRPVEQALLDPDSQYVSRGRYAERLEPYLQRFSADQLHVVVQERLLADRRGQLSAVYAHVGADPGWDSDVLDRRFHVGDPPPALAGPVRQAFWERVQDDVARFRDYLGDDLAEWTADSGCPANGPARPAPQSPGSPAGRGRGVHTA